MTTMSDDKGSGEKPTQADHTDGIVIEILPLTSIENEVSVSNQQIVVQKYDVNFIHEQENPLLIQQLVPPPPPPPPPPPTDWLCPSIFACLCCIPSEGMHAILNSRKANEAYARGDFRAANAYSGKAKAYCMIGVIFGFIIAALVILKFYLKNK